MKRRALSVGAISLLLVLPCFAQLDQADRKLAREILQQLIEINTTDSVGNVSTASEAMAKRLRDAGFADRDIYFGGTEPDIFHGGTDKPVEVRVFDEVWVDGQEAAQSDMGQLLRDVGATAPQTHESGSGATQHDL